MTIPHDAIKIQLCVQAGLSLEAADRLLTLLAERERMTTEPSREYALHTQGAKHSFEPVYTGLDPNRNRPDGVYDNNSVLVRYAPEFVESLVSILREGADIISGIEAHLDDARFRDIADEMIEVRDWWRKADAAVALTQQEQL